MYQNHCQGDKWKKNWDSWIWSRVLKSSIVNQFTMIFKYLDRIFSNDVSFYFSGFVRITDGGTASGGWTNGYQPPGRSHQTFHSQTCRGQGPPQPQRYCQKRWPYSQLWHSLPWETFDGNPRPIQKSLTRKMRKTTKIIEKKIRQCHILTLKSYFTSFHFLKVLFLRLEWGHWTPYQIFFC